MKQGSKLRRCKSCRKPILWLVPTGEIVIGLRCMETKFLPACAPKLDKGYYCKDCYAKLREANT